MEIEKRIKFSAKDLGIAFDFEFLKYENRIIELEIRKPLIKLEYNFDYFGVFMEELLYWLSRNGFQTRWDFLEIWLNDLEKLELSKEDLEKLKKDLKSVSNWDIKWKE
ncbi:unknown; predicted coding region [Mycoplasmopsis pulmonis]|uniref:Uncharacterized protein n=1 Tax=Mycoplasmopsis pulmonis (strain UAB CTIP) TaxID=272635 RepID=Q98RH8_MYCPU|nr:hypothetical protein [Mycoplasmopsis pulmonis]MDZ7293720.1 hypothetical protein [Mycoplasmopsis pulmonis]CAC13204.1 unknown; predicted coding region [Mycoplasmopsis pulmonis]VEU67823.1 Uncharacterised protein [Mycoplasmopsis pulmonis]